LIRLVAGDFLERARSTGFFLTLALTLYLAYTVAAGYWVLRVGDFTGEPSWAWIGLLTALLSGTLLSWLGFYVARGSLTRDREGGVGELLAASPLSRPAYLLSKSVAAALLLVVVVGVLALGAAATAALRAPGGPHPLEIARLFLLFAVPPVCVAAGAAVFFDATPGLRGGFGNFLYFFLWGLLLAMGIQMHSPWLDLLGFQAVVDALQDSATRLGHDAGFEGFSLSIAAEMPELTRLGFPPVEVDASFVASRAAWIACGLLIPLLAVPWTTWVPAERGTLRPHARVARERASPVPATEASGGGFLHLPTCAVKLGRPRLAPLVGAELRLMLRGWPWWWYLGVAALWVAASIAPAAGVRAVVLPLCALWGALLWSPLGNRPRRHAMEELLAAIPGPVVRPVLAGWLAGVAAAAALFAGVLLRWLASGELASLAVLVSGILLLPAVALALGELSGVPKTFEVAFVALWYVGPLNGVPSLDFLGVTPGARPATWLAVTLLALALAVGARWRRLAR
jgi:hypothetical protein